MTTIDALFGKMIYEQTAQSSHPDPLEWKDLLSDTQRGYSDTARYLFAAMLDELISLAETPDETLADVALPATYWLIEVKDRHVNASLPSRSHRPESIQ